MTQPLLLYFADPMCSWCWGFSPVIAAIREEYRDRLKIALILGGLRPGTEAAMTAKEREDGLRHWREVAELSHQPFRFEGALPEGFVHDTEPACRAVVTVAGELPENTFAMFRAIQAAFHTLGEDVTQPEALARLAQEQGLARERFLELFDTDTSRRKTLAHFQMARKLGVTAFPTLLAEHGQRHLTVTRGYQTLDALRPQLDALLR